MIRGVYIEGKGLSYSREYGESPLQGDCPHTSGIRKQMTQRTRQGMNEVLIFTKLWEEFQGEVQLSTAYDIWILPISMLAEI